jgi:hypothetical protein
VQNFGRLIATRTSGTDTVTMSAIDYILTKVGGW